MRECEEMLKIVQGCRDSRLDSWVTCDWQATKVGTRVKHAGKLKSHASYCTIGQKSQASQAVSSQFELTTQPSLEAKSPNHPVWKKLTFHIPSHPTIYRPLYPQNVESFLREFWERNPREKQDWLIHNLHIETLQIPLLSSSPLLNPWEVHYQNLFSPYPYLWEGCLVLWKAVKKGPIHIGRCYGQVAEFGKLKKK